MVEPMLSVPRRVLDAVLGSRACMVDHSLDDCPARELKALLARRTVVVHFQDDPSGRWLILKENDDEVARRQLPRNVEVDGVSEDGDLRVKFVPAGSSRRVRDWTKAMSMPELIEWIKRSG